MVDNQPAVDSISDEIVACAAAGSCPDINGVPYVARGVIPKRGNVRDSWVWTKAVNFKARINVRGVLMYYIITEDGKISPERKVDGSTFNRLARELLHRCLDEILGRDPNNPDEADFVPTTNRK